MGGRSQESFDRVLIRQSYLDELKYKCEGETKTPVTEAIQTIALEVFGQSMFDVLYDKNPNDVFSAHVFLRTNQSDFWYDFLNIDRKTGHEITMRFLEKHGDFHPNALDRRREKNEKKAEQTQRNRKIKLDKKRDLALQLVNHTEGV